MTKTELVKAVAVATGLSLKASQGAVDAVFSTIVSELKKGNDVKVMNFGKFVTVDVAASVRMNPKTREVVNVPAHKAVRFRVSSVLKRDIR